MSYLMKNHFYRVWENKARILIMLVLSFVSIVSAIWMTNTSQTQARIAVVGMHENTFQNNESFTIIPLEDVPKQSTLIQGVYDAVILSEAGEMMLFFTKNDRIRQQLEQVLFEGENKVSADGQKEGVARTIFGYVLMFLLMLSVSSTFLYTEDKEKHRLERMLCGSTTLSQISFSYAFFIFGLLWVPSLFFLGSLSLIFQVDLGLSLIDYAILLGILSWLGTTFALCNAAFFKEGDQSNMIGSMIVLLTSLVSGNFFQIETINKFWEGLTKYLPQQQFLSLVTNLEHGESYGRNVSYLC